MDSTWVTPYAWATRARSSASRISSPRGISGTATMVAGGIRSRAAKIARTSASGGRPSGPGPVTGMKISRCAARVRAACAIWASCGRCSGRSAITPSTRPGGSRARTSSGVRRSRWNGPCPPSPIRRTAPPIAYSPSVVGQASVTSIAATGAPSGSVSITVRRPRIVEVQAGGHLGGDLAGDRDRPRRAVGQPAAPAQRGQVGPAEKAGQRGVRAGEQQFEVGELVRARRVRRRVTQHVLGQHRTVHR